MAIPNFCGDEDKNEINPKEWLRMVKKTDLIHFGAEFLFSVGDSMWWNSFDEDNRPYSAWEKFEELFSNKWINDKTNWRRCIKFKWN
jgi:hypothetical protein